MILKGGIPLVTQNMYASWQESMMYYLMGNVHVGFHCTALWAAIFSIMYLLHGHSLHTII